MEDFIAEQFAKRIFWDKYKSSFEVKLSEKYGENIVITDVKCVRDTKMYRCPKCPALIADFDFLIRFTLANGKILETLKKNGKSLADIQWVGCKKFTIPIENFCDLAEKTKEWHCAEIADDLLVVGRDFWVERALGFATENEYVWVYKGYPIRPEKEYVLKTLDIRDLTEEEENHVCADSRFEGDISGDLYYSELWMMLYKEEST